MAVAKQAETMVAHGHFGAAGIIARQEALQMQWNELETAAEAYHGTIEHTAHSVGELSGLYQSLRDLTAWFEVGIACLVCVFFVPPLLFLCSVT